MAVGVCGVRREGETAPCLAPALGSRCCGNDDGGVGERRELMAAEGEVPASAGTTGGGRPFEFPQGERASPPLWIPAFAGMAMGVCGVRREGETAPCLAPALGSRFRENDDGGVGERRELMAVEGEVPASTGTTGGWEALRQAQGERTRGSAPATGRRGGDGPTPRACPGFPRKRERRWGCAGLDVLVEEDGVAVGVLGDEAVGAVGGLVGFTDEGDAFAFELSLQAADVGEGV